ncbi:MULTISPECIES: sensor domain-containing diguanylate cyclase [unclassified Fusibacter]|uniref:sensor domain-containing diguanylate cyclase n=1 Tax=unclassified Fusibacter TaxID=2624464 RepID=UPI0010131696|nr:MULTISPECIES: sensor domain-containing diguanylate cyclase [unclassified Fusibacter]MCK8059284.1 sensor domain-containing diguanylate cyclase [Fusibacter sp. A2]NPE21252.1 GGDEF domain-containing protein [Fusibacter sp. A1]RXV62517.1 GGDEF domain-containing protein [Fusibacter sp. A1]
MKQQYRFWLNSLLLAVLIFLFLAVAEWLIGNPNFISRAISILVAVLIYRFIMFYRLKDRLRKLFSSISDHNKQSSDHPLGFSFDELFIHNLDAMEQHLLSLFEKTHDLKSDQVEMISELERLAEVRDAMFKISTSILMSDDEDELYDSIVENAIKAVKNASHGSLAKLSDQNIMRFLSVHGYNEAIKNIPIDLKKTFLWIEEKGQIDRSVIINDILAFNKANFTDEEYNRFVHDHPSDIQSAISSPIIVDGRIYGMINVDSGIKNAFKERDIAIMEYFSKQVAILFKNKELMKKTNYLSRFDTLTGVYNRNYFEEVFSNHIKKALRYNEEFCIIKIDVAGLSSINDSFGQSAGDQVLKHIAQLLRAQIRDSDLLARLGGDQFIMVFFGSDFEGARSKVIHMKELLSLDTVVYKEEKLVADFHFSIAHCPLDGKTYDDLIRRADERLRLAKKERND